MNMPEPLVDDPPAPEEPATVIVDAGGRVTVAFSPSIVISMSLPALSRKNL